MRHNSGLINETPPEGLAGIAVKLRCLREHECDPEGSSPGAELAQCIDAIEREIAR